MDFTGLDPVLAFLSFAFSFLVIQFAPFVKRAYGMEMSYLGVVLKQKPVGTPCFYFCMFLPFSYLES